GSPTRSSRASVRRAPTVSASRERSEKTRLRCLRNMRRHLERSEEGPRVRALRTARTVAVAAAATLVLLAGAREARAATVTLNGLTIELDEESGTLRRLSHPALGVILDAARSTSGILSVSAPLQEF